MTHATCTPEVADFIDPTGSLQRAGLLKVPPTTRERVLVELAILARLTPAQATVLPTVLEVAARKIGMSEVALISDLTENRPALEYIASVCRSVSG